MGSLVCEVFQNNKFVPVAEACSYVAEIVCESLGNKNKKSMVGLTWANRFFEQRTLLVWWAVGT